MAYRELGKEGRKALRRWLAGEGVRAIARARWTTKPPVVRQNLIRLAQAYLRPSTDPSR